jgi:hypothetical protein
MNPNSTRNSLLVAIQKYLYNQLLLATAALKSIPLLFHTAVPTALNPLGNVLLFKLMLVE